MTTSSSSPWPLVKLEDAMEAIIDYRGKTPTKTAFGIPLVTAKIVKGGRIERRIWDRNGCLMVNEPLLTAPTPLKPLNDGITCSVRLELSSR